MLDYFKWFMRFWGGAKVRMTSVVILTVITMAAKTAFPVFLKYIFDLLEKDYEPGEAYRLVMLFLGFALVHELLSRVLPMFRGYMNAVFAARVRDRYYDIFTGKAAKFFQRFRTGDLLTRLTDDVDGHWDRLAWYSCSGIMRPVEAILNLAFILAVMFYYFWKLALFTFVPLPFLVLVLALFEDKMVRYTRAKQKSVSDCNNVLEACFSGIKVIKTTLSEKDQMDKYREVLDERVDREKDFLKINQVVRFFSMLVNNTGQIIVIFAGSVFMVKGTITLGTFLMFIVYLQRLVEPIWTISWFYASSKQVFRYVDRLVETEEKGDMPRFEGTVPAEDFRSLEFRDVSYRFEDGETDVLEGVSFGMKKGETVAVMGQVGSGKTTLLDLVAGNLFAGKGEILVNGSPRSRLKLEDMMKMIGYVRQDNVLFSETVRRNIELGDEFSEDEIDESLDVSMMTGEIDEMPKGLETEVGQRGVSLSGGQKQRLSIARTLIRRPKLLLLDDCTAAMDAQTEKVFWENIKKEMPGLSCLVVTHRPATARRADRVMVIRGGKLQEITDLKADIYGGKGEG